MSTIPELDALDLGALGGDEDDRWNSVIALADVFGTITGIENLELRDGLGCTDCKTFIQVPKADRCSQIVAEHELSHLLGGTDLALAEAFRDRAV